MSRQPPPWWPENEPWPPGRHRWRRMRGHYPFFRRLGCLFAVFSLLGVAVFTAITVVVINGLGIIHLPVDVFKGLFPVAGIFLALMIVMVVLAGTNLRRMSVPLDDLLAASNRVAEGDYSARVEEKGTARGLVADKSIQFNGIPAAGRRPAKTCPARRR